MSIDIQLIMKEGHDVTRDELVAAGAVLATAVDPARVQVTRVSSLSELSGTSFDNFEQNYAFNVPGEHARVINFTVGDAPVSRLYDIALAHPEFNVSYDTWLKVAEVDEFGEIIGDQLTAIEMSLYNEFDFQFLCRVGDMINDGIESLSKLTMGRNMLRSNNIPFVIAAPGQLDNVDLLAVPTGGGYGVPSVEGAQFIIMRQTAHLLEQERCAVMFWIAPIAGTHGEWVIAAPLFPELLVDDVVTRLIETTGELISRGANYLHIKTQDPVWLSACFCRHTVELSSSLDKYEMDKLPMVNRLIQTAYAADPDINDVAELTLRCQMARYRREAATDNGSDVEQFVYQRCMNLVQTLNDHDNITAIEVSKLIGEQFVEATTNRSVVETPVVKQDTPKPVEVVELNAEPEVAEPAPVVKEQAPVPMADESPSEEEVLDIDIPAMGDNDSVKVHAMTDDGRVLFKLTPSSGDPIITTMIMVSIHLDSHDLVRFVCPCIKGDPNLRIVVPDDNGKPLIVTDKDATMATISVEQLKHLAQNTHNAEGVVQVKNPIWNNLSTYLRLLTEAELDILVDLYNNNQTELEILKSHVGHSNYSERTVVPIAGSGVRSPSCN